MYVPESCIAWVIQQIVPSCRFIHCSFSYWWKNYCGNTHASQCGYFADSHSHLCGWFWNYQVSTLLKRVKT